MDKKIVRMPGKYFTEEDQHTIIQEIISNGLSKKEIVIADQNEESFENLQLKKRIFELEKQLKEAEQKAIAYSTMVDIAEKEFKIPIRKKLSIKP